MTVDSGQTLTKIQSLARLYQAGYHSSTIDNTISKLVAMERSRLEHEAKRLTEKLNILEKQYNMPSVEFYRQFQAGKMGDDADLFEWSAFYQMWLSVQKRLQTLPIEPQ